MKTLAEAITLYQEERYLDASRRLALVTQFEPENVEGWMYYGAALAKLGRWAQAVEALRRVVKLRPDQVSGYCELAAALIEAGDKPSAHAVLDQAASLDPAHPSLRSLRARLTGQAPPPAKPAADEKPARPARARRRLRLRGLVNEHNRLPLMLGVLVALVIITLARVTIGRSTSGTQLAQATELLARADVQAKALAKQPGEDFDVDQQVNQLLREAESLALAAQRAEPGEPRVYALLARIAQRQHDPRRAWEHASHGLDLSAKAKTPDTKLRAQLLLARAVATADLAYGPSAAATLAQARTDATEAAKLDPGAVDAALDKRLAAGR
ncbi:MAG: tetratricopeptide repeat protein [Armatimonadetes bacterium]|nr:tetratricopeptide repeat protein [Armatimonadota bacterium]